MRVCGRYYLTSPIEVVLRLFGIAPEWGPRALTPRYNIAPRQRVPIVRVAADEGAVGGADGGAEGPRELALVTWGLVPHWSRGPTTNLSTINARAESIATSPAFRDGFRRRRCIFPVNGWYEWRTDEAGAKAAYAFSVDAGNETPIVGLAGVWDRWREPASKAAPDGVELHSAAIITTASLGVVREYHDRMPLVLAESMWGAWLAPTSDAGAVLGAAIGGLSGGDGAGSDGARVVERVVVRRVSSRVNSPRNDDPSVLERWVEPDLGAGGEDSGGAFGGLFGGR